jgi:hypothetical protein
MKLLLVLLSIIILNRDDCVMFRGGGFSGFWYFYNKTDNIRNSDKIYCYSSGCLAVIASIPPNNKQYIYDTVLEMKHFYKNKTGKIYEIREKFIDNIINIPITDYNINIITSTYTGKCIIEKPDTIDKLRQLLLDTTNIPIITSKLGYTNIDGIFCRLSHPMCKTTYSIPKTFRFIINIFNPFLTIDDVNYFSEWNN